MLGHSVTVSQCATDRSVFQMEGLLDTELRKSGQVGNAILTHSTKWAVRLGLWEVSHCASRAAAQANLSSVVALLPVRRNHLMPTVMAQFFFFHVPYVV